VRDFKLPSNSYADLCVPALLRLAEEPCLVDALLLSSPIPGSIDKYCFYRSETSPPLNPQSPPTSLSSGMVTPQQTSGTSSPFSLDMAAVFPSLQTKADDAAGGLGAKVV
jgi:hypothetical protein